MGRKMNWRRARRQPIDTTTVAERRLEGYADRLLETADRQKPSARSWGSKAVGADHTQRALDSSHRPMVITDGRKSDGTLWVLTGDAARRAWAQPIRPLPGR